MYPFSIDPPPFFCLLSFSGHPPPSAYGGSQARGPMRAVAANLHHSSQQCWIFKPLNETRDRTRVLMDAS